MVCKIIFCSEFPDIPNKAGSEVTRGRTQANAKKKKRKKAGIRA